MYVFLHARDNVIKVQLINFKGGYCICTMSQTCSTRENEVRGKNVALYWLCRVLQRLFQWINLRQGSNREQNEKRHSNHLCTTNKNLDICTRSTKQSQEHTPQNEQKCTKWTQRHNNRIMNHSKGIKRASIAKGAQRQGAKQNCRLPK